MLIKVRPNAIDSAPNAPNSSPSTLSLAAIEETSNDGPLVRPHASSPPNTRSGRYLSGRINVLTVPGLGSTSGAPSRSIPAEGANSPPECPGCPPPCPSRPADLPRRLGGHAEGSVKRLWLSMSNPPFAELSPWPPKVCPRTWPRP